MRQLSPKRSFPIALALLSLLLACGGGAGRTPTPAAPSPSLAPSMAIPTPTELPSPMEMPTSTPVPTRAALSFGPVTEVTGTDSCPGLNPNWAFDPDGTAHVRDLVIECVDETDDPRVSGTITGSWSMDVWGDLNRGVGAGVQWGSVRLANDGGTWEGKLSGVAALPEPGDTIVIWYTGTGGYAGLSYFQLLTGHEPWKVRGQIFPGIPPNPTGTPPVAIATPLPTATAASPTPTAVTFGPATVVTGTAECPGLDITSFAWTANPDGTQHVRDDVHANRCTVTSNDPRVSGSRSSTWNIDFWGNLSVPRGALVQWGTARLENDGGAWEGRAAGIAYWCCLGDIIVDWYAGTGAYGGLSYFELWLGSNPWTIQGLIFPGDPPMP